ncbi:hypothetical protein [Streptomyces sp. CA-251251]|uniref:hypothetical protein n=1 Tax=Streptomyces sp. CA-251251 TaxID=3240063 RepID=UPI003D93244C
MVGGHEPVVVAEQFAALRKDLMPAALRIWGPDHLGSLMIRGYLAEVRVRRDRAPADGLAAFSVLLDDCIRVLGPDHHTTEATRAFREALRQSGSALPTATYDELLSQYAKAERSGRAGLPSPDDLHHGA